MTHNLQIAIVDYGMGNLFSVRRACEFVGLDSKITTDKSIIMDADGLILPGVGAFGDAMDNLRRLDLIDPIKDYIRSEKQFMGICLGMQLLFSKSEEFGNFKGLDIINGSVVRFPIINSNNEKIKVPQVGWNQIYKPSAKKKHWDKSPLKNINDGEFMYFVHSYYPKPLTTAVVLSTTTYEETQFCSSILWKNVFACQFHPEKSSSEGIKIYKNWVSIIKNAKDV